MVASVPLFARRQTERVCKARAKGTWEAQFISNVLWNDLTYWEVLPLSNCRLRSYVMGCTRVGCLAISWRDLKRAGRLAHIMATPEPEVYGLKWRKYPSENLTWYCPLWTGRGAYLTRSRVRPQHIRMLEHGADGLHTLPRFVISCFAIRSYYARPSLCILYIECNHTNKSGRMQMCTYIHT